MKRLPVTDISLIFVMIMLILGFLSLGFVQELKHITVHNSGVTVQVEPEHISVYNNDIASGLSYTDSLLFQNQASQATTLDLPEELPSTGDHMCAYVRNDTIFIEYYHKQKDAFHFLYNY